MGEIRLPEKKNGREATLSDKATGLASLITGGYVGKKIITNGLPGVLGFQIEEHTTSKRNAKNILEDGYIRASKGGSIGGLSSTNGTNLDKAKGHVFITGANNKDNIIDELRSAGAKIGQRLTYGAQHSSDTKNIVDGLKNMFDGKGDAKTVYVIGTPKYFKENFTKETGARPNILMTNKDVKAHGSKAQALFSGLKEYGLKGIKENKGRAMAYLAGTGVIGYEASRLLMDGHEKLKGKKN